MRVLDVILGLGALGVAVAAAKLIADAASVKQPVTVALPPASSSTQSTNDARPVITAPAGVQSFDVVQDCTGDASATQACWCWGGGYGKPECKDFDYSILFDGQSTQN